MLHFDNSYARLPERAFARLAPHRPQAPRLVRFNRPLAQSLGLECAADEQELAMLLSGAQVPQGAEPLAQAYAGHQFGHFSPQLGDGRAHLLGEILAPDGRRYDVQLKGSGRTPFSRGGDGKAALGPMMREYIISEALAGLGIRTTRSLAIVLTGEAVAREAMLPGAVLTRVAASHIRVGTFQYFAARGDGEMVRQLTNYTLARHYPQAEGDNAALALYHAVIGAQARLIAQWMGVGFIHGVMNTDNMALSGESIDFGPCAFLDEYHADMVFSSIDSHGRYAYGNQGRIAQWNLARFAETLLPFFDDDEAKALDLAHDGLATFADLFAREWHDILARKIGFASADSDTLRLAESFLTLLQEHGADFTVSFRQLAEDDTALPPAFTPWLQEWHATLDRRHITLAAARHLMQAANPALIARNHQVEAAILAGTASNDFTLLDELVAALATPFAPLAPSHPLVQPPTPDERVRQTYCGT